MESVMAKPGARKYKGVEGDESRNGQQRGTLT